MIACQNSDGNQAGLVASAAISLTQALHLTKAGPKGLGRRLFRLHSGAATKVFGFACRCEEWRCLAVNKLLIFGLRPRVAVSFIQVASNTDGVAKIPVGANGKAEPFLTTKGVAIVENIA